MAEPEVDMALMAASFVIGLAIGYFAGELVGHLCRKRRGI